jgi:hypothetical protein
MRYGYRRIHVLLRRSEIERNNESRWDQRSNQAPAVRSSSANTNYGAIFCCNPYGQVREVPEYSDADVLL